MKRATVIALVCAVSFSVIAWLLYGVGIQVPQSDNVLGNVLYMLMDISFALMVLSYALTLAFFLIGKARENKRNSDSCEDEKLQLWTEISKKYYGMQKTCEEIENAILQCKKEIKEIKTAKKRDLSGDKKDELNALKEKIVLLETELNGHPGMKRYQQEARSIEKPYIMEKQDRQYK